MSAEDAVWERWKDRAWFVQDTHAGELPPFPKSEIILDTTPYGGRRTIHEKLVWMVRRASKRVFVCSFLLGERQFEAELRAAAKRLHGHVYVVTAIDDGSLQTLQDDVDDDPENPDRRKKRFKRLTTGAIWLRGAPECHAKFCLVDDQMALIATANFDANGLGTTSDGHGATVEVAAYTEDREIALGLGTLFRSIWSSACRYEARPEPDESSYELREVAKKEGSTGEIPRSKGLIFTGFGQTGILDEFRDTVASARHQLSISSYSLRVAEPGGAPLFIEPILDAAKRGVHVELYLRSRPWNLQACTPLVRAGIEIRADRYNHAKYVIADGKRSSLYSANLDTLHGLDSGIEVGVRLDQKLTVNLEDLHRALWARTTAKTWVPAKLADIRSRLRFENGWPHGSPLRVDVSGSRGRDDVRVLRSLDTEPWMGWQTPKDEPEVIRLLTIARSLALRRQGHFWIPIEEDKHSSPRGIHDLFVTGRFAPGRGWLPIGVEVRTE